VQWVVLFSPGACAGRKLTEANNYIIIHTIKYGIEKARCPRWDYDGCAGLKDFGRKHKNLIVPEYRRTML
jgi:hypothetical protein